MLNKIILVVLSAFLIIGCKKSEESFSIEGTIKNYPEKYIRIMINGMPDSVLTDKGGKFKYRKVLTEPSFIKLSLNNSKDVVYLITENTESVVFNSDASDFFNKALIEGSPASSSLREFSVFFDKTDKTKDSLKTVFQNFVQDTTKNRFQIDSLDKAMIPVLSEIFHKEKNYLLDFIKKNYASPVSMTALFRGYDPVNCTHEYLDENQLSLYFNMIDTALSNKNRNSRNIDNFHISFVQYKLNLKKLKESNTYGIKGPKKGDPAPEITLPDYKGNEKKLSSLKGKIVLLDFWASWCQPCRKFNPGLVAIYSKFKNRGFEIFQVSLDQTKDSWLKAIENDNLKWDNHVSDLKYWNSPVVSTYHISGIPANFLIDKNGIIVAKNLSYDILEKEILKLLDR